MSGKFLRIDQKTFDFSFLGHKDELLKISENGRGMRISIYLDMESSNWLYRNLLDMTYGNAHVGWVSKFRGPKSTLVLEQQQNRYGRFGRLTEITRTGSSRFITIPEGYDQKGWRLFAQCVTEGSFQGDGKLKSNDLTKSPGQNVIDRSALATVKMVDSGDSALAYAEVKKDVSAGRALARPEGDWRKAFVCERERISDSWAMIQAELVGAAYNIGIFHWRPTDSAKKLAKEWKELLLADEKIWDQNGFNDLVRRQLGPSVDEDSGLVYAFDGNLKLGLLPASIFCSGHTYFVQAMFQQLRLEPYAVHTTFQYAGTEGKRHRLREAMVFYDPPEYYDSPGGFVSFKPSIPKSLLLDGEHTIESHFSLVNYQIKQIRTALAIASLLNRTLVMPPLWCRLDRLWFPHPGALEGSMTRQPFLCPLDHVFEVNVMLKEHPEEEFGPGINIREYSFFDNPYMPKQVKESWLDVQLCQEGSQDCHVSNNTSSQGVLRFPKRSNEETYKTVFSSFKDVKVIQFSSMQDAFLGFIDKTREDRFRNRVKRYVGIWCCVENHSPGHIYYDMYWDETPGWKPIPPQNPADDHPPW